MTGIPAQLKLLAVTFLFLTGCVVAPPADEPEVGRLKLEFLYKGRPVSGSLIISDGAWRREWRDVRSIDAEVPARATYTIDLKPPGDPYPVPVTFRDIIPEFTVPAGGERSVVVRVQPPGGPRAFVPVVLVQDAGPDVRLDTTRLSDPENPSRVVLRTKTEQPPGIAALIDGVYLENEDDRDLVREFTCGDNCPHIFKETDCSVWCFGCSSTCVIYHGYWKGNVNMCSLTSGAPQSDFDPLPSGTGGVNLTVATRRDGVVRPLRTVLTGATGSDTLAPPFKVRRYPDFTVPVGSYRFEAVFRTGRGLGRKQTYALPVTVTDGRIAKITLRLPEGPLGSEPHVLADNRLGVPERRIRTETTPERTILSVETAQPDPDPGTAWLMLAVPDGRDGPARIERDGTALVEGTDYLNTTHGGRPVVVLATHGRSDRLRVIWSEG